MNTLPSVASLGLRRSSFRSAAATSLGMRPRPHLPDTSSRASRTSARFSWKSDRASAMTSKPYAARAGSGQVRASSRPCSICTTAASR